jgi:hypothetical protein
VPLPVGWLVHILVVALVLVALVFSVPQVRPWVCLWDGWVGAGSAELGLVSIEMMTMRILSDGCVCDCVSIASRPPPNHPLTNLIPSIRTHARAHTQRVKKPSAGRQAMDPGGFERRDGSKGWAWWHTHGAPPPLPAPLCCQSIPPMRRTVGGRKVDHVGWVP